MEDAARFALDDAGLCEELKSLRHELRAAIDQLLVSLGGAGGGVLEANRDAAGDVGTAISTESEMQRPGGLLDVVIAAGKRLTESLRVIEEVAKTLGGSVRCASGDSPGAKWAGRIEALRYRAYDVDARLQLRFGSGRAVQWKLCLILTQSLCKRPWRQVLGAAIEAGCDCVQVREKEMDGGELLRHVKEVRQIVSSMTATREDHSCIDDLRLTIDEFPAVGQIQQSSIVNRQSSIHPAVIVNDRVDVAIAAGADGVHVGQHDLSVRDVRRLAGRSLIVGVSTHNMDEAKAAVEAGADYCGVGAMFATSLKPDRTPSGPGYLQAFVERYPNTPHLAIGGITPDNVQGLIEAGARGLAVSTAICGADDPGAIARILLRCPSAICSS